ncbi:hypothetical protein [Microbacterium sp. Se63.02b]|uniref:hypothetical protein n=2 Tax=unclassified Microbacterium TaxID=2609290 RepID=UPI0016051E5F|nr:hypothetical protein [Microbacterium sp. Se63.02b]QNA93244.1 hypothetical protein G4G29_14660 [Microbacterium sp. Se63.02b]
MVWITLGSVVVTGFLAWLAYANGRKATLIAEEASLRDEAHRQREVDQREREERAQVALAMMRSVSAAEQFANLQDPGNSVAVWQETVAEVEQEMHRTRAEALAHVELYSTTKEDAELRPWIESALHAVAYPGVTVDDRLHAMDYLYFVRRAIRLWNAREVTAGLIIVGTLPPEAGVDETGEAPMILV